MPILCRSPPESRALICPMSVSYPWGRVSIKSPMPARRAAVRISSRVAPGLAMPMFWAMVASKR